MDQAKRLKKLDAVNARLKLALCRPDRGHLDSEVSHRGKILNSARRRLAVTRARTLGHSERSMYKVVSKRERSHRVAYGSLGAAIAVLIAPAVIHLPSNLHLQESVNASVAWSRKHINLP